MECTDRNLCTPHYRNFCVKVDETSSSWWLHPWPDCENLSNHDRKYAGKNIRLWLTVIKNLRSISITRMLEVNYQLTFTKLMWQKWYAWKLSPLTLSPQWFLWGHEEKLYFCHEYHPAISDSDILFSMQFNKK